MAEPPVLLVTRIWLGRTATLARLRWNMYTPESMNRLMFRAVPNGVLGPVSLASCIVITGFDCCPSVVRAST